MSYFKKITIRIDNATLLRLLKVGKFGGSRIEGKLVDDEDIALVIETSNTTHTFRVIRIEEDDLL